jgi:hypothetical protein
VVFFSLKGIFTGAKRNREGLRLLRRIKAQKPRAEPAKKDKPYEKSQ